MAKQKRALVMLHDSQHYQREAFADGLRRHGYDVTAVRPGVATGPSLLPDAGDVLVCWNVQPFNIDTVKAFDAAGAAVLVAENGYIGADKEGSAIALSRGHHNGAGWTPYPDHERFGRMGVALMPWRTGSEIVIVPQRSIGEEGVRMPPGWPSSAQQRLRGYGGRVVTRAHPGLNRALDPIESALQHAYCVVTWGSGGAIKALALGIPVFHEFPKWIGAGAATFGIGNLVNPKRDDTDRYLMFCRLAWAQWSASEIRDGVPFDYLLGSSLPADWRLGNDGQVRSPGRDPMSLDEALNLREILVTRSRRHPSEAVR